MLDFIIGISLINVDHDQARKTESSLQRIRQGAQQRRGGASSDVSDHNVSDTDKICMQLFLDIQVGTTIISMHDHFVCFHSCTCKALWAYESCLNF